MTTNQIKLAVLGFVFLLVLIFQPFRVRTVDSAHEGILIKKFGSNRGAQSESVAPGFHIYNSWYEQIETYPNHVVTKVYSNGKEGGDDDQEITVTTRDGMVVDFNCGLNYRIKPGHGPAIFINYRKDLPTLENSTIWTWVRGAYQHDASNYNAIDLYENRNAFESSALSNIKNVMDTAGFDVQQLQILGKLHFPDQINTAINNKVTAGTIAQTKQQEIQQKRYDSAKVVIVAQGEATALLTTATAQSRANALLEQSLSPMLLQKMYYEKWDGKLPGYMMGGNTLMQLPVGK